MCTCVEKTQQKAHIEALLRAFYTTHNSSKVKPPHATRHTPHVARHTSHVTRHTLHVTRSHLCSWRRRALCSGVCGVPLHPLSVTHARNRLAEEEAGLAGGKGALWRLLKRLYRLYDALVVLCAANV